MADTVLTSQVIDFFQEHGWWVSPAILDEDLLDELKFGVQRYLAGDRDWQLSINLSNFGDETSRVRQTDYLSLQLREFRRITEQKQIGAIAAGLVGTTSVRLFHDQLVTKPPYDPTFAAAVGWHTDKAYWSSCSSDKMVTAWIPVDDVPEESGPLAVWDRSHRWPDVESLHTFGVTDLVSIEDRFRANGLVPNIVLLPMRRGQVSFHHCRLVHGGFANRTSQPRFGYAIHMQDAENRYVRGLPGHGHQGHINDLMCRRTPEGDPDYEDPDIFPVLWP